MLFHRLNLNVFPAISIPLVCPYSFICYQKISLTLTYLFGTNAACIFGCVSLCAVVVCVASLIVHLSTCIYVQTIYSLTECLNYKFFERALLLQLPRLFFLSLSPTLFAAISSALDWGIVVVHIVYVTDFSRLTTTDDGYWKHLPRFRLQRESLSFSHLIRLQKFLLQGKLLCFARTRESFRLGHLPLFLPRSSVAFWKISCSLSVCRRCFTECGWANPMENGEKRKKKKIWKHKI